MVKFDFSQQKNAFLFEKRGVTFYNVIEAIAEKGVLLNFDNPNREKYPNRKFKYLIEGETDE